MPLVIVGILVTLFQMNHWIRDLGTVILDTRNSVTRHDTLFEEGLGATNAIETPVALFETSLQNGISSTATTMTLTSATTKDGTTLASSTYSFIISEGEANEEFVKADCTATACTNMVRGISALTGTTSVAALKKEHRRGDSVKITSAPLLVNLTRILNGNGDFPNRIRYNSSVATSTFTDSDIINKAYADYVGSTGCSDASATARGCVELGTQIEVASSTSLGATGAALVIPASMATSSPGSAGLWSVVTNNAGKIAQSFLNLAEAFTFTSTVTTTATTTIPASSLNNALVLNSIPFVAPNTQGASSTAWINDGTGKHVNLPVFPIVLRDTTTRTVNMTNAAEWYTIRANYGVGAFTSFANDIYRVQIPLGVDSGSGTEIIQVGIGINTATITPIIISQGSNYYDAVCTLEIVLKGATNSWDYSASCPNSNSALFLNPTAAFGAASTLDLANGFNVVASSTNSTQAGRVGTSNYLYVERLRQ